MGLRTSHNNFIFICYVVLQMEFPVCNFTKQRTTKKPICTRKFVRHAWLTLLPKGPKMFQRNGPAILASSICTITCHTTSERVVLQQTCCYVSPGLSAPPIYQKRTYLYINHALARLCLRDTVELQLQESDHHQHINMTLCVFISSYD